MCVTVLWCKLRGMKVRWREAKEKLCADVSLILSKHQSIPRYTFTAETLRRNLWFNPDIFKTDTNDWACVRLSPLMPVWGRNLKFLIFRGSNPGRYVRGIELNMLVNILEVVMGRINFKHSTRYQTVLCKKKVRIKNIHTQHEGLPNIRLHINNKLCKELRQSLN